MESDEPASPFQSVEGEVQEEADLDIARPVFDEDNEQPEPSPMEAQESEEVWEEAVPDAAGAVSDGNDEQPEQPPVQTEKSEEVRSLIDAVSKSGNTTDQRAASGDNPVRALLNRIGQHEGGAGGKVAQPPSAAGDIEAEPDTPAPLFGHSAPAGIFDRVKEWREADAPGTAGPKGSGAKDIDEPGPDGDVDDGVVTVEELGNLADLILPKSATFTVDELSINRSEHRFNFVDNARVVSEFDDLFSQAFSSTSIAAAVAEVAVPAEEVVQPRFGFLKKFQLQKVGTVAEEYNPSLHGPLVDLTMRPSPGLEEIELYPVNEPYAYVRVTYDSTTHEYTYNVLEPVLTPAEQELFGEIKERLFETLNITTRDLTRDEARTALRDSANTVIADYGIHLPPIGREKILYHVEKEFLGDGLIDPVMHDKYIEDISCDGVDSYIFVYHTTYESMKTSLVYHDAADLDSFVTKLAQRAGKYISIAEPMLDATMSDGSRIQMTLGAEVTAHGSTFTIRKFREEPITPTDLIEWHTFSPLGIAFIWLAIENAKSCIFAGGTASGKTTTLNALSLFIPPLAKIVTLEDTRELKLPHPNWIPSITRDSFSQDGRGGIDMYELLRAALRQRPEYILVGEVRGKEALTLFQAMSTGHVTYATMHADSVASAVHRLENPPIDVPRNMLSALSLVSIQVQARVGGQRIRRNKQLIEILDIDPRTNELITNEVFRWHPATDEIRYSGKSYILEQIMEDRGWSEERMREELKRRQEVLEWMRIKKIRHFQDVSKILVSYFRDPETVIQRVRADLYGESGSA
ncbi:type II/IV secretion system ATPase subunit [Methanoculleus sp.]|uniref:type II/IV secretion system ATPase subunit n=1 Tax=Methanoculleus sp. TaxID=90427 RepID=UPI0026190E5F|nr:type II/IV secretion system ATPase subunit [Methanoculleus sp.]